MNRLTRDGTAEPVSRDQILRHARRQGNTFSLFSWPRAGLATLSGWSILCYICDNHTYICRLNERFGIDCTSTAVMLLRRALCPSFVIIVQKKSNCRRFLPTCAILALLVVSLFMSVFFSSVQYLLLWNTVKNKIFFFQYGVLCSHKLEI